MTNPTNWPNPERPGVPLFPDRDGWHALIDGNHCACYWDAKKELWWNSHKRIYLTLADISKSASYCGPVLTAAQVAEMLAGERRRCAKLVKQEVTNLVGDKRQFLKKAHLRTVLKSIIQEIRNLGDAA